MLSRVANNVYWANRYLERAEDTARMISVHGHLLLDLPRKTVTLGWEPLIAISGSGELFFEHYRSASEANVVKFLLSDEHNPSAIINVLRQARENLRTTRDIIPREAWEELNDFYLFARRTLSEGLSRHARYDFLKLLIRSIQRLTGLLHGTMSHGIAYNFLRIGCYLERADMTTRILDVRSANLLRKADEVDLTPFENIQWMSVLKSLSGYQMYRQQVRLRVQGADVLNFLLRDNQFPRAFFFCLERTGYCLKGLPNHAPPLRRLRRLQRQVQHADVDALARTKEDLHAFIDELQIGLNDVHNGLHAAYFSSRYDVPELTGDAQWQRQSQV